MTCLFFGDILLTYTETGRFADFVILKTCNCFEYKNHEKEVILSFLNYHSNNVDNKFIRNQAMHVSKRNIIISITKLQIILLYNDNKHRDKSKDWINYVFTLAQMSIVIPYNVK